jgi:hypothetical protein
MTWEHVPSRPVNGSMRACSGCSGLAGSREGRKVADRRGLGQLAAMSQRSVILSPGIVNLQAARHAHSVCKTAYRTGNLAGLLKLLR